MTLKELDEVKAERFPNANRELERFYPEYPAHIHKMCIRDSITIRQGMEFGVQVHTIPRYQKLYEQYDFDLSLIHI